MQNRDYTVSIRECSAELTAKQRIQLKDTTESVKLDKATQDGAVTVDVDFYAVLDIHNEKSEDKDYVCFVLVDKDGTTYTTGSQSFWNSFMDIYDELHDSTEPWALKIYRMPSKNRQGKDFITCSVI